MVDGSRRLARSAISPEGKENEWPTITEHNDLKLEHCQMTDDLMEMEDQVLDLENQVNQAEKDWYRWKNKYDSLKRDYKTEVKEAIQEGSLTLFNQADAYRQLLDICSGYLMKDLGLWSHFEKHPNYKRLMKIGGLI